MFEQQEPLLFLEVSTLQGPELHLDVSEQQEPALDWTGFVYITP